MNYRAHFPHEYARMRFTVIFGDATLHWAVNNFSKGNLQVSPYEILETKPDNNNGSYVPCPVAEVRGFFDVPY